MRERFNKEKTKIIVGIALITAMVVILQLVGSFIKFGPFSVSLVLVPIVVGAALYGRVSGGWLGLVFGVVVLLSGDAAFFMEYSPFWTIVIVLVKGIAAGLCAGLAYNFFKPKGELLATIIAAAVCPIVNTGIFLIGGYFFLLDAIKALMGDRSGSVVAYMFVGLVGLNFVFELLFNLILSPMIVRIIKMSKKIH